MYKRQNADIRLTEKAHALGLASDEMLKRVEEKKLKTKQLLSFLKKTSTSPEEINTTLKERASATIKQKMKIDKVLSRPNISIKDFTSSSMKLKAYIKEKNMGGDVLEQAEIEVKYMGYIKREKEVADKIKRLESVKIPKEIDFFKFSSLSNESKEKLTAIQPATLGHASRISGIKPSDISILMVYLGR